MSVADIRDGEDIAGLMAELAARYGESNRRLAALRPNLPLAALGYPGFR